MTFPGSISSTVTMNIADYREAVSGVLTQPALFITISGAHLYGFPSTDSDVDLRGCHVLPVNEFIRLQEPRLTVNQMWTLNGVEFDLVSHDLIKYVTLLLRQNGNYLEQLFSPLVVLDTSWAEELRELVRQGTIARHVYHAYSGYAREQWSEWRKEALVGAGRLKPLLYAYRVSLTGLHLLRTGEVNASLVDLAPEYGYAHLLELVAAKTAEKAAISMSVDEHDHALAGLQEKLQLAFEASPLPETPTNRAELDDFVVRARWGLVE